MGPHNQNDDLKFLFFSMDQAIHLKEPTCLSIITRISFVTPHSILLLLLLLLYALMY